MHASLPGDDRDAFASALSDLTTATAHDDLCDPFFRAADMEGAVLSTLGAPLGSQTICASDALAARIDEIQIDLGEGPCWDAVRTRTPVLEPDLQRSTGERWPGAFEALRGLRVRSLHAFPLFVGDLNVGCVDIYSMEPRRLSSADVDDLTVLAGVASRHVLRWALDGLDADDDQGLPAGPHSRREIHQASGMIAAQLSVGVGDALTILRGRAFSSGRSVAEVAADVVARRATFDD